MSARAPESSAALAAPISGRAPRVAVRTLGCKVNQVESEQIVAELLGAGWEAVSEDSADVVVVNTCTVTGESDSKARKTIRHALRLPGRPSIVVTGCLAAVDATGLRALDGRVIVEHDVAKVAEQVSLAAGVRSVPPATPPVRSGEAFHTRAMVKIEDGCDAFCTYCIVPYARGLPRSVPADTVLRECEALVESGVREIVLTGINLGRYEDSGLDVSGLIRRIASSGIPRLRISSIEPLDLTEELLETLGATPAVCEHLHVPLQSGNDAVLRDMGRSYTTGDFARRLDAARQAIPGLAVSTDVIVGFPGETETQAEETRQFCLAMGFARLHVFRYSARSGTPAADRVDHVDPRERADRAQRMRVLDAELRGRHGRSRVGEVAEVLVERVATDDGSGLPFAVGTTRDYLRVRFAAPTAADTCPVGALVPVRLETVTSATVTGSIVAGTDVERRG